MTVEFTAAQRNAIGMQALHKDTCVVAGPMFAHRLAVHTGERVERDGYAYCDLVIS